MDSLTPEEFNRLDAYDRIMPLDHSERMLGLLAYMIANFLGFDMADDGTSMLEICMPWLPEENTSAKAAQAALSPVAVKMGGSE